MEVVSIKEEDMLAYGKITSCKVFSAIIKISDIKSHAKEMIDTISDTSWLDELRPVEKISFEARAKRTIDKIVSQILERVENHVTSDFGEFMVSGSAQTFLEKKLNHIKVPLAELLKEKISGNPGFDFHTESTSKLIAFGEAKYSASSNPYANAINQIIEFIEQKKDDAELTIIQHFVSQDSMNNYLSGSKSYTVAFSINSENPDSIISNTLKSCHIDGLLHLPEIFIIGVQVGD